MKRAVLLLIIGVVLVVWFAKKIDQLNSAKNEEEMAPATLTTRRTRPGSKKTNKNTKSPLKPLKPDDDEVPKNSLVIIEPCLRKNEPVLAEVNIEQNVKELLPINNDANSGRRPITHKQSVQTKNVVVETMVTDVVSIKNLPPTISQKPLAPLTPSALTLTTPMMPTVATGVDRIPSEVKNTQIPIVTKYPPMSVFLDNVETMRKNGVTQEGIHSLVTMFKAAKDEWGVNNSEMEGILRGEIKQKWSWYEKIGLLSEVNTYKNSSLFDPNGLKI